MEDRLRGAILELNRPEVDAILSVGTNVPILRLADEAERWLGKPVLAINTATYWYAMRANGFDDVIEGFGSLMTEFRELPKAYLDSEAGRSALRAA